MKQYIFQNAVALDQLANTMIPGGMADETLSARAYRMREKKQRYWGWLANAIDALFFWQRAPSVPRRVRRKHLGEPRGRTV